MSLFAVQLSDLDATDDNAAIAVRGLSPQKRETIAATTRSVAAEIPALEQGIEASKVSVLRLTSATASDICPNDHVLLLDDKRLVDIFYVDFRLGNSYSPELRQAITDTIFDTEQVSVLLFSTSPLTSVELTVEELGGLLAEQLPDGEEQLPEAAGQATAIVQSTDPYDETVYRLLEEISPTPIKKAIPNTGCYFVLQNDTYNSDDSPVDRYQFQNGIPGSRQLREGVENGWFVYQQGETFYATGCIGQIDSKEETARGELSAKIPRYTDFPDVVLETVEDRLSVDFPTVSKIIDVTRTDIEVILQEGGIADIPPEYESIGAAYADIRTQLDDAEMGEWLLQQPATAVIGGWTDGLAAVEPGATLSWRNAAQVEQVIELYEEYQTGLAELAATLNIGQLSDLSQAETLFVVLIRDLQDRAGLEQNFNAKKFEQLRDRAFSIQFPDSDQLPEQHRSPSVIEPPAPPSRTREIEEQLMASKQIIFHGPPGTSKTYTAQQFANWWVADQDTVQATSDQVRMVTFHPSFSYQDFVEGLTANATAEGGVSYRITDGVFKRICNDAREAYQQAGEQSAVPRYVLIIDELNRGNIAEIFGELITLLEADKRLGEANETSVELAHSGTLFEIPPNLYVIGTMNTADQSISLLDTAIRRRFRFLDFQPDYELLYHEFEFADKADAIEHITPEVDLDKALQALSVLALEEINNRLLSSPDIEKGKQVGHTYLLGARTTDEIYSVWRYEILPLLEDLFYGQLNRLQEVVFNEDGNGVFDWENQRIAVFDQGQLVQELLQLADNNTAQSLMVAFTDQSEIRNE